ncbi:MAG: branched-chain amino acid ABC transporter permease [Alphaproteobacteria bacterium]
MSRSLILHLSVLVLLLALHWLLPAYHHASLARIMVLAVFAMGYNILFGYTGLLSLGHAMFFAAGLYGAGMSMALMDLTAIPGFLAGLCFALLLSLAVGALALRTAGVSFMIVTLMLSQAAHLLVLYLGQWTRGDEGFVIDGALRAVNLPWAEIDLTGQDARYLAALGLFALTLLAKLWLVGGRTGQVLTAIRENEARAVMLGYDAYRYKLWAMALSGAFAGAAGAAYAILFGSVGASFASIQYSILPLLYVLLGGAGTVLGPFLGTLAMFYLIDIASGLTGAYLLFVGIALIVLVLAAPKGLLGSLRERAAPWLP